MSTTRQLDLTNLSDLGYLRALVDTAPRLSSRADMLVTPIGEDWENIIDALIKIAEYYAGRKDTLAEAYIRGFQEGAERPEDSGDGDAMGQAFREWREASR